MTLDDFRIIFQLPQATDNNHERFIVAPKFSKMVPFFLNDLGFTLELRSPSNFKKTGLVQPWQTLCKMFSRWKNKEGVGIKIPSWMITGEMKLKENYQMYAIVFGVDVPTTQLQPIESTQGTHRITSAPRWSTRLTPPTPIPTAVEVEEMIIQDTIQLSIVEQKSRGDLKAKQNEEKVKEHLIAEEIEKLVEGMENVGEDEVDNSILNSQNDPGTRSDPGSYKESPEVEKTADVQPVNVIEEEEESVEDDYELRRSEKGKDVEETRNTPPPTPTRSTKTHYNLLSLDIEKLQELTKNDPTPSSFTPSSSLSKLSATK
ncbi:hypothetical protein Tco_1304938 [Tanacetum coccineum]